MHNQPAPLEPERVNRKSEIVNPLARIDELGRLAADSLRNASRYPLHARTYRDCADTYNLVAGSTASDLGLATMLWDAPEFPVPITPISPLTPIHEPEVA